MEKPVKRKPSARKRCDNAMNELNRQRLDGEFCDVVLVAEEKKFNAHRCVLATASEFFRTMFKTEMKEKYENEIPLQTVPAMSIDALLDFIYTGEINLNSDNAEDILSVASFSQTPELTKHVCQFIESSISSENCLTYQAVANLYKLDALMSKANDCILKNFSHVSRSEQFLKLPLGNLEEVLLSENLTVESEDVVYNSLISWIKHDIEARKPYFPTLFKLIRLQHVSYDCLSDEIRKEPLVLEFPACRDMVYEAMDYHIRPHKHQMQQPRKAIENDFFLLYQTKSNNAIKKIGIRQNTCAELQGSGFYISAGCAVATWKKQVAFCGGIDENEVCSREVIWCNGKTTRIISPMLTPRSRAAAAFVNGDLYVIGGKIKNPKDPGLADDTPTNVEMLVEEQDSWIKVADMTQPRWDAAAIVVKDQVYLLGGANGVIQPMHMRDRRRQATYHGWSAHDVLSRTEQTVSMVEIFNTTSRTWEVKRCMNAPRSSFGAAYINHKIYVFGGVSNEDYEFLVEFLNCDADVWTKVSLKVGDNMRWSNVSACAVGCRIAVFISGNKNVWFYDPSRTDWTDQNLFEKLPYAGGVTKIINI